MTINEVKNAILSMNGTMARTNKTNYIVIPCEDGIAKIAVTRALDTDNKRNKAFNLELATAEYRAWEAEQARKEVEKASAPVKEKAVNVQAQARRDALDSAISALPAFEHWTATDILNALPSEVADQYTVMAVGSSAKRLVEREVLTTVVEDKRSYYTKA